MKFLFLFLSIFLLNKSVFAQQIKTILSAPNDWNSEQIAFPLGFAPDIQLKGFEDIRFAPGWSDPQSEQFWTYHFTWVLEQPQELDASYLETTIISYFDGLAQTVLGEEPNSSVKEKIAKTVSQFRKTENGFTGLVKIFDAFHTMSVITLNVKVREQNCSQTGKQLISFNLSPKPFDHQLWDVFKNIEIICQ